MHRAFVGVPSCRFVSLDTGTPADARCMFQVLPHPEPLPLEGPQPIVLPPMRDGGHGAIEYADAMAGVVALVAGRSGAAAAGVEPPAQVRVGNDGAIILSEMISQPAQRAVTTLIERQAFVEDESFQDRPEGFLDETVHELVDYGIVRKRNGNGEQLALRVGCLEVTSLVLGMSGNLLCRCPPREVGLLDWSKLELVQHLVAHGWKWGVGNEELA